MFKMGREHGCLWVLQRSDGPTSLVLDCVSGAFGLLDGSGPACGVDGALPACARACARVCVWLLTGPSLIRYRPTLLF